MTAKGAKDGHNKYAVGNKTYGAGRSMPTVGRVSKLGYRERDLKKMAFKGAGFDAIGRRLASPSVTPTVPPPISTPNTATQAPDATGLTKQPNGSYAPSPSVVAPLAPQGQPQASLPPQAQGGNNAAVDLPYDPEYSASMQAIARRRGLAQSRRGEDEQKFKTNAFEQQRSMEQQHPRDLDNIRDNFAGRGLLHSGRFIGDTADEETNFANRLTGLQRALTEQLNQLTRGYQDQEQGWMDDENSALQDAIRRRAAAIANQPAVADPNFTAGPADMSQQPAPVAGQQTLTGPGGAPKGSWMGGPSAMIPQAAPTTTTAPTMTSGLTWSSPDAASRKAMDSGQTVTRGNGYVYSKQGGQYVRIR